MSGRFVNSWYGDQRASTLGLSQFPKQFKEKLPHEISALVQKFILWDFQSFNRLEEGVKQIFFPVWLTPAKNLAFTRRVALKINCWSFLLRFTPEGTFITGPVAALNIHLFIWHSCWIHLSRVPIKKSYAHCKMLFT